MKLTSATAISHPNIAFIKYWGNRDNELRLPVNGSISMNLDGLFTRTTVSFTSSKQDLLSINGKEVTGKGLERVSYILDLVRVRAGINERAEVTSENNFPAGAGIASSAAAFAGYLRDIEWKGSKTFAILQGEDMGMPSRLNISFTSKAGESISVSGEVRKMG